MPLELEVFEKALDAAQDSRYGDDAEEIVPFADAEVGPTPEDVPWVDPAGGEHSGAADEDPAALYE